MNEDPIVSIKRYMEKLEQYDVLEGKIKVGIKNAKPELGSLLSKRLDVLSSMYYLGAASSNSGSVFQFMWHMTKHRDNLEAIGAKGFLLAFDGLLPFYKEYESFSSDPERNEYWNKMESKIERFELMAEDDEAFADLLVKYAKETVDLL